MFTVRSSNCLALKVVTGRPDRRHVHEAVATVQKIAVSAVFKIGDAACSWRATGNTRPPKQANTSIHHRAVIMRRRETPRLADLPWLSLDSHELANLPSFRDSKPRRQQRPGKRHARPSRRPSNR